jgi:hypothetical protein
MRVARLHPSSGRAEDVAALSSRRHFGGNPPGRVVANSAPVNIVGRGAIQTERVLVNLKIAAGPSTLRDHTLESRAARDLPA